MSCPSLVEPQARELAQLPEPGLPELPRLRSGPVDLVAEEEVAAFFQQGSAAE